MKLKSLLFAVCFSLMGHGFAANQHMHPKANEIDTHKNSVAAKPSMIPGYCEIEVINSSNNDVWVYGTFDDGAPLNAFRIFQREIPHYISLYYYGYCHNGMYLTIEAIQFPYNTIVYNSWTPTNSTIRIVPYIGMNLNEKNASDKKIKVEVVKK